ncbi:hypothetical protein A3Q56_06467 [Intoshia linei]|uniref:Uncharacterized protein n=1 Tax=Intoshia linei TaxID=1819745 RepID=A0A177AUZ0_9BILA|nr:hypothetical protein A3Q56_06467 [Intoshia linei]
MKKLSGSENKKRKISRQNEETKDALNVKNLLFHMKKSTQPESVLNDNCTNDVTDEMQGCGVYL